MLPLNLTRPDYSLENRIAHNSFRVLKRYLEPYTSVSKEQAGQEILENVAKYSEPSTFRHIFSDVCVQTAEQIPCHHSAHIKLVQLIAYLAKYPEACEEEILENSKIKIYQPFPRLLDELNENLNVPDEETTTTFVNLHAFAAVLLRYDIFPFDPTLAVWAHISALEDNDTSSGVIKEMWIMAAGQFILRSGPTLYEHILFPQEILAEQSSSWMPGPLYKGKPAFSVQRWRFWRDRYKAVSQDAREDNKTKYTQECKDIARRAAKLMEALDEM